MENIEKIDNVHVSSNEITFRDLILVIDKIKKNLLSNWLLILVACIVGGGLGLVLAHFKKTTYTATTTFVLEDKSGQGGLGQYAGLASMAGVDLGASGEGIFQGDNIIELYKSRSMIQRTLLSPSGNGVLLIDQYLNITKFRESQTRQELKDISFNAQKKLTRTQDSILGNVVDEINQGYLTVGKRDKKLSIIEVRVSSKSEEFAKEFCEQIVKTVNDFYIQTKTSKSLQNLAILQHQTDSVRNVLNGVIYNSVAVADATPNLNPTRQVLRVPAQRSQANAEANKAILVQLVQNLELAKITLRKETPLIQVIDQPIPPLPASRYGKLKTGLLGAFTLGFVTVLILTLRWIFKGLMA